MSLKEKLEAMRAASRERTPKETQEIMHRAVEDLRSSGILDRVAKVGDRAPEFTLSNTAGEPVASRDLLRRGPLVVAFYRGKW